MEISAALPKPTEAQLEWARCRSWIADAMASNLDTVENVECGVAEGRLVFWAGPDCAAITRIDEYPGGRVLTVVHAGGNIESLLTLGEERFERAARLLGCRYVGVEATGDYVKALADSGFKADFTVMLKPVAHDVPADDATEAT